MLRAHALLALASAALFASPVASRVFKVGNTCTVVPAGNGRDDSASIVSAFSQCKENSSVVFLNQTYHVERVMQTYGLKNVNVDVRGTLVWGTNTSYWIANSLPLGYQNQSLAWDFSGDNIVWDGHNVGTFDGNGQTWYNLANGQSNMFGRPINFVVRNSTNFRMQNMRFVQSQFWTLAVHTAKDVVFDNIFIRSVSNNGSYEYAQDRPTSTPVVAWYAGASTSLGPITDGHQLALLYKIVHTTYAPKRVGQPNCLLILQTCAPWRVLL